MAKKKKKNNGWVSLESGLPPAAAGENVVQDEPLEEALEEPAAEGPSQESAPAPGAPPQEEMIREESSEGAQTQELPAQEEPTMQDAAEEAPLVVAAEEAFDKTAADVEEPAALQPETAGQAAAPENTQEALAPLAEEMPAVMPPAPQQSVKGKGRKSKKREKMAAQKAEPEPVALTHQLGAPDSDGEETPDENITAELPAVAADATALQETPQEAQKEATPQERETAKGEGEQEAAAADEAAAETEVLADAEKTDKLDAVKTEADKADSAKESEAKEPPADSEKAKKEKKAPDEKTKQMKTVRGGKRRRKRSVAGIMIASVLKLFFVLFCLALVAVAIAAVQVTQYVVEATANDDTLLDLETIKLNQTSYFMALNPDNPRAEEEEDWVVYQELVGPEHRIWVSIDHIPDNLINAVIAIEDRTFETHHGVDIPRTMYAIANEFLGLSDTTFGASTIEQQLIKNITGEKDSVGESGYTRKMREIYRAWQLDQNYTKDMIMEAYLNTISLSGTIGGVQAGANEYFGKDVSELTLAECAMIAGITRAPGAYDPYLHPDTCLARRNSVLAQMLEIERITQEQYDEAVSRPLGVIAKGSRGTGENEEEIFSYFSDQVFNEVVEALVIQKGMTEEEAKTYLYTGGLRVHTTVDMNVQSTMEDMYTHGYDEDGYFTQLNDPRTGRSYKDRLTIIEEQDDGTEVEVLPQSAAVIIDYEGALKGVVGGIGKKTESLVLNRATQSYRQVGSTMKPIAAYALGIENGLIDYSTTIVDSGVRNRDGSDGRVNEETGEYSYNWPRNVSGRYRNTAITVNSAIAESTNTIAVKVGMRVGVEEMYDFLVNTLQVSSLVGEGQTNDKDLGPLVLGSMTYGMSAYELAGAYMMFGNGGEFNSLHSYTEVLDPYGNVVVQAERTTVQAISPSSAFVMNRLLRGVIAGAPGVSATANGIQPEGEMDAVAKTGTTSDNKDRWFVGLTPYYVTAVWWGYDDNYENSWGTGRGNVPPNVWKTLLTEIQADYDYRDFPAMPDDVVVASYCAASGELATSSCPQTYTGYYAPQRVPDTCSYHSGGWVSEAVAEAAAAA